MNNSILECRKDDKSAVIKFNIPIFQGDDIFTASYEFCDLCSDISSDNEIRVLVILLESIKASEDKPTRHGFHDPEIPSIVESVAGLDIPVIIGMDGYILGPDLELALACDVRIASHESFFGFPGIKNGIIPFYGGTQRLPRIVGRGKALEMILTGNMLDSRTGYETGLVNRMVDRDELESLCIGMAREMSEKSPVSMMYSKEAINKGMDMTLEQGIRLEADLYFLMHTTHDRTEGIKAFQKKRSPDFKGK